MKTATGKHGKTYRLYEVGDRFRTRQGGRVHIVRHICGAKGAAQELEYYCGGYIKSISSGRVMPA